jgi:hypothetical protein
MLRLQYNKHHMNEHKCSDLQHHMDHQKGGSRTQEGRSCSFVTTIVAGQTRPKNRLEGKWGDEEATQIYTSTKQINKYKHESKGELVRLTCLRKGRGGGRADVHLYKEDEQVTNRKVTLQT